MEKVSLPTRTVATNEWVVVAVAAGVILVMLAWIGDALYLDAAERFYMRDFRRVVMTGQPIRIVKEGQVETEWTLFEEGGRLHALRPSVEKAWGMNPWSAETRYIYARALWREYLSSGNPERTRGGFVRGELPANVVVFLRQTLHRDPMNEFYRETLAGVLTVAKDTPGSQSEADQLLQCSPQNACGQVRTAEILATLGGQSPDKSRLMANYSRALELVGSDFTWGLLDTSGELRGDSEPQPLGPVLVARAVDGLLRDVASYDVWAAVLSDQPEVHWHVAVQLRTRGMSSEANLEYEKVVTLVRARLAAEARVSTIGALFEMFCPLSRPDYPGGFLTAEAIGEAADVLRMTNRPDEAVEMQRIQIARSPQDVNARLVLGEMLLERAAALTAEAQRYRSSGDAQKAGETGARADRMYEEVDEQVSAVLDQSPRLARALDLRARIPKRTAETPTP